MDSLYDGFDVNENAPSNQNSGFVRSDDSENPSMHQMSPSMNMVDSVRPMTSNKSAGYSSSRKKTQNSNFGDYKGERGDFKFVGNGRGSSHSASSISSRSPQR